MTTGAQTCPLCGGVGTIELRLRRPADMLMVGETEATVPETWTRRYPCPECHGQLRSPAKLVYRHTMPVARLASIGEAEATAEVRSIAGPEMVQAMIEAGFICVSRERPPGADDTAVFEAVVMITPPLPTT